MELGCGGTDAVPAVFRAAVSRAAVAGTGHGGNRDRLKRCGALADQAEWAVYSAATRPRSSKL
jgi:hypothetical protein